MRRLKTAWSHSWRGGRWLVSHAILTLWPPREQAKYGDVSKNKLNHIVMKHDGDKQMPAYFTCVNVPRVSILSFCAVACVCVCTCVCVCEHACVRACMRVCVCVFLRAARVCVRACACTRFCVCVLACACWWGTANHVCVVCLVCFVCCLSSSVLPGQPIRSVLFCPVLSRPGLSDPVCLCMCVHLSVCPSVCLSVCLSVALPLSLLMFVSLSHGPSVSLSLSLSLSMCIYCSALCHLNFSLVRVSVLCPVVVFASITACLVSACCLSLSVSAGHCHVVSVSVSLFLCC